MLYYYHRPLYGMAAAESTNSSRISRTYTQRDPRSSPLLRTRLLVVFLLCSPTRSSPAAAVAEGDALYLRVHSRSCVQATALARRRRRPLLSLVASFELEVNPLFVVRSVSQSDEYGDQREA